MSEQPVCPQGDGGDRSPMLRLLRFGEHRGPDAACPPEYADMPVREVFARIDADLIASAMDLLDATRAQDADALLTQGSFLRTKFSGSDLDL